MTTEHFDLANPVTKVDDIPDYEMYSQTIDSLNKRFGNRVLKGIEIGYIASEKGRIIDYLALYEYVIDLYLSRGGTLFSVGSDGHYLEHFRFHFDNLFALLKAKGVTELAIYQKGKRIMVPLPV